MTAKRWFVMLGCIMFAIVAYITVLNMLVDPFSVFGDKRYSWYSYGMTNNPKAAKFDYIDNRLSEYDAFIIGPSGASGISPDVMSEYTGLRWYNMFNYGADIRYTKRLAEYLVKTHRPEQMLLVLPAVSARIYAEPAGDVAFAQPLRTFWRVPFILADPKFAMRKLENLEKISYIQQPFDVFIAETGVYNKTRRDAEAIGSMEDYLVAYPEFAKPWFAKVRLENIDECAAAVADIADVCRLYGTKLTIVTSPILAENAIVYDANEVRQFCDRIAEISEFWDFSVSSVSCDPRYFYDVTHFRNSVGDMMLARMFGDESVYIPEDFGIWITRGNTADAAASFAEIPQTPVYGSAHTKDVPILLYQHIGDGSGEIPTVTPSRFEEQMKALYDAGYTAVSLGDICDYVSKGRDLPENPVVITFDGGYMSTYTDAFPILQRFGFKAVIFTVGASFGNEAYKDAEGYTRSFFGEDEALEMIRSDLISIQSHSFDTHLRGDADMPLRNGILRINGETEEDYIEAFKNDFVRMSTLLRERLGEDLFAFSYPYGAYDVFSSILLRNMGVTVTFTMEPGVNTLLKGLPQSLLELKRFSVTDDMTGDDVTAMIY